MPRLASAGASHARRCAQRCVSSRLSRGWRSWPRALPRCRFPPATLGSSPMRTSRASGLSSRISSESFVACMKRGRMPGAPWRLQMPKATLQRTSILQALQALDPCHPKGRRRVDIGVGKTVGQQTFDLPQEERASVGQAPRNHACPQLRQWQFRIHCATPWYRKPAQTSSQRRVPSHPGHIRQVHHRRPRWRGLRGPCGPTRQGAPQKAGWRSWPLFTRRPSAVAATRTRQRSLREQRRSARTSTLRRQRDSSGVSSQP
mmetsp:Transcript_49819/g.159334  ORF Transcript_49819/g.159334 Transcript_49819/m.159334 type:complete len:260 (+) Transcript_49819:599-1378(+)